MIFNRRKIRMGYVVTMSANGTLTLVKDSLQIQVIRGTLGHSIKLPAANTMRAANGVLFTFINESTQSVLILNDASATLMTLVAGGCVDVKLADNSTANGVWRLNQFASSGGGGIGYTAPGTTLVPAATAFFMGGSITTTMDYISMVSFGVGTDFGDLTQARSVAGGASSAVRAVVAGGAIPADYTTSINYFNFSSLTNAQSFGTLSGKRGYLGGASNDTRALFAGGATVSGSPTWTATTEYVEIATTGSTAGFGNLSVSRQELAGMSNTTRAIFGGGYSGSNSNVIDYYTFTVNAVATDFGDLQTARYAVSGSSNGVIGTINGGFVAGNVDIIDYFHIASASNGSNFGSLTLPCTYSSAASGRQRSLIHLGDATGFSSTTKIETLLFATLNKVNAFGDLSPGNGRNGAASCSNAHGGLA